MQEALKKVIEKIDLEAMLVWLLAASKEACSQKGSNRSIPSPNLAFKENLTSHKDIDLLKSLLPKEILQGCLKKGPMGQMLLSFAMRHQATLLNIDLDKAASNNSAPSYLTFLSEKKYIPVVGFSSLGFFMTQREKGSCRAFCDLDIQTCHNKASSLYCKLHPFEGLNQEENKGSRQAKMRRFYFELDNINAYGEEELNQMIDSFWQKIHFSEPFLDYNEALAQFDLSDIAFNNIDLKSLQARYHKLCHLHHPDKGGAAHVFHNIQLSYKTLKSRLKRT